MTIVNNARRKFYNCELTYGAEAAAMCRFLKEHDIYYEASGDGVFTHFEMLLSPQEAAWVSVLLGSL